MLFKEERDQWQVALVGWCEMTTMLLFTLSHFFLWKYIFICPKVWQVQFEICNYPQGRQFRINNILYKQFTYHWQEWGITAVISLHSNVVAGKRKVLTFMRIIVTCGTHWHYYRPPCNNVTHPSNHPSSTTYPESGHGGSSLSRETQTSISTATVSSTSRGTPRTSQTSRETLPLQSVLGLPLGSPLSGIFPKTLTRAASGRCVAWF